jgi:hypothetical protein
LLADPLLRAARECQLAHHEDHYFRKLELMSNAIHFYIAAASLFGTTVLLAQTAQQTSTLTTSVPRLVRITGSFHPSGSASGVENATLSIYASETSGTPLWQEIQNVTVDPDGHYSLLLGTTRNEGLPMELFAAGEPRWLGVQFQRAGETEQKRILLASVPYALKAADAETLGGRPLSDECYRPDESGHPASNNGHAGFHFSICERDRSWQLTAIWQRG